jgi:hypothetical protein
MTPHLGRVLCIATTAAVAGLAQPGSAQARPDTTRMTCAAAQALVARHGGIVLGTGRSLFDRFVVSRAHCMPTETIETAFVPTRDNRHCFIGYTCREAEPPDAD